jgi:hypothetical protein
MDADYINRLSFTAGGTNAAIRQLGEMILRFNFHDTAVLGQPA